MIGCLIRSYGLTDYLPAVLKCYNWVDRIVIANYRFVDTPEREDKTKEICKGLQILTGDNVQQHEALNYGLECFDGFDYVFIADADELITKADQDRLIKEMTGFQVGLIKVIDYAWDLNHRFPERTHHAIVIARPRVRFYEVRCCAEKGITFKDIYLHHFGYVFKEEDINWKRNWEKRWEGGALDDLLGKVPIPLEMPEEIKSYL